MMESDPELGLISADDIDKKDERSSLSEQSSMSAHLIEAQNIGVSTVKLGTIDDASFITKLTSVLLTLILFGLFLKMRIEAATWDDYMASISTDYFQSEMGTLLLISLGLIVFNIFSVVIFYKFNENVPDALRGSEEWCSYPMPIRHRPQNEYPILVVLPNRKDWSIAFQSNVVEKLQAVDM